MERENYRLVDNRFVRPEPSSPSPQEFSNSSASPLAFREPPATLDTDIYLPLYEAKMIHHFDHRFGSFEGVASRSNTEIPTPTEAQYADPARVIQPWYWAPQAEVSDRLREWPHGWLLGFRDITNTTNERTAIFSLLPLVGVGNKIPLLISEDTKSTRAAILLANLCSIPFDYIARQKICLLYTSDAADE